MTPATVLRKPKLHFDTAAHASHVTFDDGKALRRNLPWLHYVEARWDHGEPDILKIEIGGWLVVIRGHNLGPLYLAVEERSLLRLRAQPELGQDREREMDTFASELRFTKPPARATETQGSFFL
ncbi:MAG: hypothetical protein Q8N18_13565 [Opitutaceae bacterium]|nr:hypothetical protein [Opitutaceae bacterium]